MNERYRTELKFLCSAQQQIILEHRVQVVLKRDVHTGASGTYGVKSLYFDDRQNSAYYENVGGENKREKVRMRMYNNDPNALFLEVKCKDGAMTSKHSCALSIEQAEELLAGKPIFPVSQDGYIKKAAAKLGRLLLPKIIVQYDRAAYVHPVGNVRVTFDSNLCLSTGLHNFFDKGLCKMPVLPSGQAIMEVKYDALLPEHIKSLCALRELQQTAFSKYCICRNSVM